MLEGAAIGSTAWLNTAVHNLVQGKMSTYIVTTNSVTSGNNFYMSDSDALYVSATGFIGSQSGSAVQAGANCVITINGGLYGYYGVIASNATTGNDSIRVNAGGSIIGTSVGVYCGYSTNHIVNAGTIEGDYGFYFSAGSQNTVTNSGLISGEHDAIYIEHGGNVIRNSGTITSATTSAIEINSSGSDSVNLIDNSGTLTASGLLPAITTGDASAHITNTGHIGGDIQFGNGTNIYDGSLGSITGTIIAGTGLNTFTGGSGIETFILTSGTDTVDGGGGNDTFWVGSNLANVSIDGGAGTDTVVLNGDYSAGITITPEMLTNVERLQLLAGHSYNLTTNDTILPANATLVVDGSKLGAANTLIFNGGKETNGHLKIIDGLGADTITVGSQSDKIIYSTSSDSTSTGYDTVVGWNFGADKFDIPGAPGTIKTIDAALTTGTLSTASFDSNLTAALSGHLLAHSAMLFKPNAGTLSGSTFLVVDTNGTAGYQAGQDLVICLKNSTGTLGVGGFV